MNGLALGDLAHLVERPFQSFYEATESILGMLETQLPDGRVLVAGLNYDEGSYRVIDARGGGPPAFDVDVTFPLEQSLCFHMTSDKAPRLCDDAAKDSLYSNTEMQHAWSVKSYVGVPLEQSDGTRVGSLCAVSTRAGNYSEADLELLTIAGRILGYEWERVGLEVELRRMRKRRGSEERGQPGVLKRQEFLSWIVREWQIARRGAVEIYLVVLTLAGRQAAADRYGSAMGDLLLKDASRVLQATARGTDVIGWLGDDRFAALLVDCNGEQGAAAFCDRVDIALARTTAERPIQAQLLSSVHSLGDLRAADQALELVGQTARKVPASANGHGSRRR